MALIFVLLCPTCLALRAALSCPICPAPHYPPPCPTPPSALSGFRGSPWARSVGSHPTFLTIRPSFRGFKYASPPLDEQLSLSICHPWPMAYIYHALLCYALPFCQVSTLKICPPPPPTRQPHLHTELVRVRPLKECYPSLGTALRKRRGRLH